MSSLPKRQRVAPFVLALPALLLVGTAAPAPAVAAQASAEGDKLVYRDGGQTMVIQAWGRDGLRVRVTPEGGGQTSDWALDIPLEVPAQIEISDADAVIRNGKISARIHDIPTQRGHCSSSGTAADEEICILSEYDYVVQAHNPGTRTFQAGRRRPVSLRTAFRRARRRTLLWHGRERHRQART